MEYIKQTGDRDKRTKVSINTSNKLRKISTMSIKEGENKADQYIGPNNWVERHSFVRLLEQALYGLGYEDVAKKLENDSGIYHEKDHVVKFREAVLNGNWDIAIQELDNLELPTQEALKQAKFIVIEQKYLEALERKQKMEALQYLRNELTPLDVNIKRLHLLANCLICQTEEKLRETAQWNGTSDDSRRKVLLSLQELVPSEVMLKQDRLLSLVEQALKSQLAGCMYHNSRTAIPSLLEDYNVGLEQIPTKTIHQLCEHTDEVWHLAFSNNGKYLASCSKNGVTLVWESSNQKTITKKYELKGHSLAVVFCSWSPNDDYLATASQDTTVKIWNMESGNLVFTITEHTDSCTSVAWMPDNQTFLTAANDCTINMWNLNGIKMKSWETPRIQDLVVNNKGDRLVTLGTDKKIRIYDFEKFENPAIIEYDTTGSALALSSDGTKLLVSTQNRQIHLWELNNDLSQKQPSSPKMKYICPESEESQRFIIRTCFGGNDEAFVLSGSEECKVYIWHRLTGELLAELKGHSGTVNSVSWNPTDPYMLASGSDDKSVHIWCVEQQQQQ